MVRINKAIQREITKFNKKMWRGEDIEHYGEPVRWIERNFIFKATEQGKIIGTIKAKFEVGVIYIGNLIVVRDKRGQGVGRKLVEKVEKAGRRLGAHKIFLFTMEKWDATKFYKKLGFKKTANLPKHYRKRDFVIYSKLI